MSMFHGLQKVVVGKSQPHLSLSSWLKQCPVVSAAVARRENEFQCPHKYIQAFSSSSSRFGFEVRSSGY